MNAIPAAIGRYRVDGLLGQGAMGVVYRAYDPEIDRPVAIKLIRADLLQTEGRHDYLMRFRREAQAAGRCSHPNIVALHDVSTDAVGNPYLVMEYVDGSGLDRKLAQGSRFDVAAAVGIIAQVLDALACAHALGVVHRDIKPANILLLEQSVTGQRVKVTDFGISRLAASDLTQLGSVIGTPSYMSPEQYLGEEAGPQSDLFSTASVFYELLSGRKAFTGSNIGQLALQLTQQNPPPIPGLPPPLQAVLDRAHAKQSEARFASAAAMLDALRAANHAGPAQTATVVLPPSPRTVGTRLDPDTIRTVEALLTRAVGPIARHLLRRAQAHADSADALVRSLAEGIDDPGQRRTFLRAANGAILELAPGALPGEVAGAATVIPPGVCDHLTRELGRHVGPIASLLVRRAAASATSVQQLYAELGTHIADEVDRAAFLAGR